MCRGGTCTAERFRQGTGVTLDEVGKLHNVSANSAPEKTLADLTVTIPNQQIGVTTIGAVRAAGGCVLPQPTARNPDHCVMSGLTPEEAERLFTPTVQNPHR
ncbi:MAG: flavoredoxin [Candidatus Tectomicrobia bacterium]|nr:flavoredoxin [Candidatus Tectomicrobia bacterium]